MLQKPGHSANSWEPVNLCEILLLGGGAGGLGLAARARELLAALRKGARLVPCSYDARGNRSELLGQNDPTLGLGAQSLSTRQLPWRTGSEWASMKPRGYRQPTPNVED